MKVDAGRSSTPCKQHFRLHFSRTLDSVALSFLIISAQRHGRAVPSEHPRRIPRQPHAFQWPQLVVPYGVGVQLCEEDPTYPIRVAALKKAKHKGWLLPDNFHADDLHLPRCAAHRRPADGAAQPRGVANGIGIDAVRLRQRHTEEVLSTRIARDEHVVGHDPQADFLAPLGRPHLGVVVDPAHQGRLRADHHTRVLKRRDRAARVCRLQLTAVGNVRHHGNVPSAFLPQVPQELQEFLGVFVSQEALRPEGQSARTDAQILDVLEEGRILEALQVLFQD
mmetsp:Transcript_17053/g.65023  ORF Transcript_17053/g.65023 Transcript_17053/m.65023 type:complete len:280 (-) Transcript_17053:772-1611(-)